MADVALGTCCCCGGTEAVVNVVLLAQKSPTPGKGWACLQCGLSPDGALAVVCEGCLGAAGSMEAVLPRLRWACRGYPATDGRVPIGTLAGSHEHDESQHPELHRRYTAPGIWVEGDQLHFDLAEILAAQGYPDTAENRALLERVIREEAVRQGRPCISVEDN